MYLVVLIIVILLQSHYDCILLRCICKPILLPSSKVCAAWSRGTFHNGLWDPNWNLKFSKIRFAVTFILMMQSGHNFAHVTTAELPWPVQNYDPIAWL